MTNKATQAFIIDCDTGRDDALSFLWTARSHAPLVGVVASYGNVVLPQVYENTARILDLCDFEEIPLYRGLTEPLNQHVGITQTLTPRQTSSGNGLCNLEFPPSLARPALASAPNFTELTERAERHGPLHYIIIGPATNFAKLCQLWGDDLPRYVSKVSMMGGRFDELWDAAPIADFNIHCDPYAVSYLLNHLPKFDIALSFISLNTTWPIALTLDEVESLIPRDSNAQAAKDLMIAHCRHFAPEPVFRFHDPAAVFLATSTDEDIKAQFSVVNIEINLDETSSEFGRLLITENNNHNARLHQSIATTNELVLTELLSGLGLSLPE
jgi:inosine-uridine nucleoside N-ribohydrolase